MNTAPKPHNYGLAIASLVLGILALLLSFVGLGILLGVLAVIFGAISVKQNRGMGITGIITGSLGIVGSVIAFILIFVILPTVSVELQSNVRDTQRKNDTSVLTSDVLYYISNNRGILPDNQWVSDMTYKLDTITSTSDSGSPTTVQAVYEVGKNCEGATSARNFSIRILLETGDEYCSGL